VRTQHQLLSSICVPPAVISRTVKPSSSFTSSHLQHRAHTRNYRQRTQYSEHRYTVPEKLSLNVTVQQNNQAILMLIILLYKQILATTITSLPLQIIITIIKIIIIKGDYNIN